MRMNWAVNTPYPSAAIAASWLDTGTPFRWRNCITERPNSGKAVRFKQPTTATVLPQAASRCSQHHQCGLLHRITEHGSLATVGFLPCITKQPS